jgi:hypothetical protein
MQTIDARIEQRGLWWAFHKHLIIEIFEWLREQLGDAYLVDLESQVILVPRSDERTRFVSPDVEVAVLEPHDQGTRALTLEPTPALLEVDEALDEVEQYAIQIRRRDLPDTVDVFGSQVIAVIELVSPANKGLTGTADRRKFLAKRRDYLASPVSYMEIDLLVEGERDLPQIVERLGDYRYMVWSSQVQKRSRHHWAWGWELTDTLPSVILPLEYPHIHTIDLGRCYAHAYERNHWLLRLKA